MSLTTSVSKRKTHRIISGVVVRAAPFVLQSRKRKFIGLKFPRLYPLILLEKVGRGQGRASSREKGTMMESELCSV
jgi:hypothetical protein